ncbi:MAG TPA: protein phosphatase 2C domain-containing protein [Anaerolineaceae bacterium]|nr:protein phosphatase 2C domain-containing protein [Anaerolineaceae bacterium]
MIRADQAHLPVTALTHPGMKGKNNEDRFAVSAFTISEKNSTPVLLAILSDGIGGHRAGEVAAEIAVNKISQCVADSNGGQPVHILQKAIQEASREIYNQAQQDKGRQGMGATCACAMIIRNRLYAATVGDSRIYLMRGRTIQQLSTDHTWVQEALDKGILTPEQVAGHPNQHVIRRYLGSPNPPRVDLRLRLTGKESDIQAEANQGMLLQTGDRILLCSDGLHDVVKDQEILAAFLQHPQSDALQYLINLANERGGPDNITGIIIEVPEQAFFRKQSKVRRYLFLGCAGILGLAALAAILGFGWIWVNNHFFVATTPTPTNQITITLPASLPETTPANTILPAASSTPAAILTQPIPIPTGVAPTMTAWPTNTSTPTSTLTPTVTQTAPPTSTPAIR